MSSGAPAEERAHERLLAALVVGEGPEPRPEQADRDHHRDVPNANRERATSGSSWLAAYGTKNAGLNVCSIVVIHAEFATS